MRVLGARRAEQRSNGGSWRRMSAEGRAATEKRPESAKGQVYRESNQRAVKIFFFSPKSADPSARSLLGKLGFERWVSAWEIRIFDGD